MTSGHHDPRDLRVAEEAPERETEAVSSSHYHEQGTHLAGFLGNSVGSGLHGVTWKDERAGLNVER